MIQDNVIPSHCWKVVARLAVMIQCPTGTVPGDMFLGPGYVAFGNTFCIWFHLHLQFVINDVALGA